MADFATKALRHKEKIRNKETGKTGKRFYHKGHKEERRNTGFFYRDSYPLREASLRDW